MTDPFLRLTLRQGTVYYMPQRSLTSPEPHYCIVLNADPCADEIIVLSIVTSKVEKRKARARLLGESQKTVVAFGPSEYGELKVLSAVDCNDVKRCDAGQFRTDIRQRGVRPCRDIPRETLRKIVEGILASRQVDEMVKSLVRGKA